MKIIARGDRITLRELREDDAAELFALNADPEVLRYTGDSAFASIEAARVFLRGYDAYAKHGMGRWAVIRDAGAELLGWCGLRFDPTTGEVDLGFRLHRRCWGQGYATEAARLTVRHGFDTLGLQRLIGRAAVQNVASVRVLEKCGFVLERHFDFDGRPGVIMALGSAAGTCCPDESRSRSRT